MDNHISKMIKDLQSQIAQLQAELKQEQLMRFHSDVTVNAAQEHIKGIKAERDELKKALQLARDMMVANDLILPKTFEVIDDALRSEGADNG